MPSAFSGYPDRFPNIRHRTVLTPLDVYGSPFVMLNLTFLHEVLHDTRYIVEVFFAYVQSLFAPTRPYPLGL